CALKYPSENIVRLTGDCPIIDPAIIDCVIGFFDEGHFDYASNTVNPTFPDGMDVEVFSFPALQTAWQQASLPSEKEHVTSYLYKHPEQFKVGSYEQPIDQNQIRLTVDHPQDFELVKELLARLDPNLHFSLGDI